MGVLRGCACAITARPSGTRVKHRTPSHHRSRAPLAANVIAHENQRAGQRVGVSSRCSTSRALGMRRSCPSVRSAGHVGKPLVHALSRWPALLHHCVSGLSRSFAERAVVTFSLMRPSLPGPHCCFVAAVCGPSAAERASWLRMRYNRAAHTDAREAAFLFSPSQSRAGGRGR